jgi:peptidoglycan L-alanyl-D-glutamate endopeptidase CwlK
MHTIIRSIRATTTPPPAILPPAFIPAAVTPQLIHQLFPYTPLDNIAANLPYVLAALAAANLADKPMLLMALATIRAEAESFLPLTEGESRFNTSPNGHPFDLYDHRRDLGNQGPPDGADFRGRGFVQLTGRANYTRYAREINQPLVANPTLAADPAIAAQLLTHFLAAREPAIRRALAVPPPAGPDLAAARRLVNGGTNGLDRFTAAYTTGARLTA